MLSFHKSFWHIIQFLAKVSDVTQFCGAVDVAKVMVIIPCGKRKPSSRRSTMVIKKKGGTGRPALATEGGENLQDD